MALQLLDEEPVVVRMSHVCGRALPLNMRDDKTCQFHSLSERRRQLTRYALWCGRSCEVVHLLDGSCLPCLPVLRSR